VALIDRRVWNREDSLLESKRHATTYRACRLHQVNRVPVIPQNRERKREPWNRKKRA